MAAMDSISIGGDIVHRLKRDCQCGPVYGPGADPERAVYVFTTAAKGIMVVVMLLA